MTSLEDIHLPPLGLEHIASGKVRETYRLDDDHLVLVTTDRISAYDHKMAEPIPNKGRVLVGMNSFWLDKIAKADIVRSHREDNFDIESFLERETDPYYKGRTEVVKTADMLPGECIVRGRLTGTAWEEYKQNGTVHGMRVSPGMAESQAFREPIFTPSTKAEKGQHDKPISFEQFTDLLDDVALARTVRDIALAMYDLQAQHAAEHGIIIADTKYEIGLINRMPVVCDEIATPDSSRFWPSGLVLVGETPPSFDKQYLRDYLLKELHWNKQPPVPPLPSDVVVNTARKYQQAYELITGLPLRNWPGIHVELPDIV